MTAMMDIALEEHFLLPNLGDFDFSELSYDSSPSPTCSSERSDYCSPLNSPTSLDTQLDSPSSTTSISSQSSNGSTECTQKFSPSSSCTNRNSKHKAKCQAPQCIKREHVSILRRNERERNRVKLVSDGFANLRKHVPTLPLNKKLSKVETLRTAIDYIRHLQKVLNESNRIERERRLLQQVGWYHEAFKLQGPSHMEVLQQNQINAMVMDLPDIAPYPSPAVHIAPTNYYSYMG